jgi:hypothetical protein
MKITFVQKLQGWNPRAFSVSEEEELSRRGNNDFYVIMTTKENTQLVYYFKTTGRSKRAFYHLTILKASFLGKIVSRKPSARLG